MGLYDDPTAPDTGTSLVSEDDPFLAWYHATPAPAAPAIPGEDPNEIQMPPMDARQAEIEMPAVDARPTIGFPREPLEPILPEQLDDDPFHPVQRVPAVDVGPPDVDAISGGSVTPIAQTSPLLSATPGAELVDPNASEMHGDQLTNEQRAQMFRRSSPEDQARQQQAWIEQRDARERDLRDRADLEQKQRDVENHTAIQKSIADARAATEKLNADAAKLANEEMDTSWHAGPGKRIAGIILGIIGGLVQSRQGGANQGLAIIDADLANQIEARKQKMQNQRAELARRGASIQQLLAFDMQNHEESVRYGLATYERAKSDIQSQMQQYDPQGKTAIQLGQTYAAIDQARAKALDEYEKNYQKNWVEMYKLDQEDRKIRISESELALKQAKAAGVGGPGKVKPDEVMQPPGYYAERGLVAPPVPMTEKQYKAWQPQKKTSQEIVANQSQGQSKEEAERGIPGLKNPDGTPFIWQGRAEDAQAFKKKKVAAEKIVRMIDDALATRTGWSSDVGNSKERQELAVLWGNATVEAKNMAELGQLTEGDMALIVGILGTNDPSKFRDPTDGMKKARQVILDNLRQDLKDSGGYTGAYDRPYIQPQKPKGTEADKAQRAAMKAQNASEIVEAALPATGRTKSLQGLADEVKYGAGEDAPDAETVAREQGVAGDVPAVAKAHIDNLAAELDDPKKASTAQAMLVELTGSPVPATANYARDALQAHVLAGQQSKVDQSGPVTSGPVTSVSYEEAPPRPAKEPNKPKKGGK